MDKRKQNWYDVDLDDVIARAEKLEITPDEMRRFLLTANWSQTTFNLTTARPEAAASVNSVGRCQDRLADE